MLSPTCNASNTDLPVPVYERESVSKTDQKNGITDGIMALI